MPPWNQMSPQDQQRFLQLIMSRGTGGMQFGTAMGANPTAQMPATPMMGGPGGIMPMPTTPGFNPLTAGQQNQMSPAMLQYILGMQGGGMQQPTLAQLLSMHGAGMGG